MENLADVAWGTNHIGVLASIVAVLELLGKVLGNLHDVKDASEDRAKCATEATNVQSLLVNLTRRLKEGGADALWYAGVQDLVENGPLDKFKQALELLQTRTAGGYQLQQGDRAV